MCKIFKKNNPFRLITMTKEQKMTGKFIKGDDGEREELCIHGVGHGGVHTCDGCCATKEQTLPKEIEEEFDKRFPEFTGVGSSFPIFKDNPNREYIKSFLAKVYWEAFARGQNEATLEYKKDMQKAYEKGQDAGYNKGFEDCTITHLTKEREDTFQVGFRAAIEKIVYLLEKEGVETPSGKLTSQQIECIIEKLKAKLYDTKKEE
jgi:hypothetical protein